MKGGKGEHGHCSTRKQASFFAAINKEVTFTSKISTMSFPHINLHFLSYSLFTWLFVVERTPCLCKKYCVNCMIFITIATDCAIPPQNKCSKVGHPVQRLPIPNVLHIYHILFFSGMTFHYRMDCTSTKDSRLRVAAAPCRLRIAVARLSRSPFLCSGPVANDPHSDVYCWTCMHPAISKFTAATWSLTLTDVTRPFLTLL